MIQKFSAVLFLCEIVPHPQLPAPPSRQMLYQSLVNGVSYVSYDWDHKTLPRCNWNDAPLCNWLSDTDNNSEDRQVKKNA